MVASGSELGAAFVARCGPVRSRDIDRLEAFLTVVEATMLEDTYGCWIAVNAMWESGGYPSMVKDARTGWVRDLLCRTGGINQPRRPGVRHEVSGTARMCGVTARSWSLWNRRRPRGCVAQLEEIPEDQVLDDGRGNDHAVIPGIWIRGWGFCIRGHDDGSRPI